MSERFDVIVIGGGHNGLTTACLMAMQGERVALVEKRDALGGLAESVEFEPGFKSAGVWHGTGNVSESVMNSLGLKSLIQNELPTVYALGESGHVAPIFGPFNRTAFGISQHAPSDGRNYARYRAFMNRIRPVLSRFLTRRPLNFLEVEREAPVEVLTRALGLRFLGSHDMVELLRVAPMPVRDFLNEYFESAFIKGALSMDAVLGTFAAPRSPGTTMNLLMHESIAGQSIKGGSIALTEALIRRARELGVQVKSGNAVTKILIENKSVKGVELENGEMIEAAAVSASCNPKAVLLDLLPVEALTHTTEHRISNFRTCGTAAHLLLAIDGPVSFQGASADDNVCHARIAPTLDHVEKAFDAIKYDRFSDEPVLDIAIPTIDDPRLAPADKSVVSVLVAYAPYNLDGGWTDDARSALTRKVIDTISRFAPGFDKKIIAAKLSSPADLENDYGLTGGHLHHGEPGLDQVVIRPIPECFNHETPVEGLTLCGSGTHPGGTVSCMAGALATREITRPRKIRADVA
ncbi:MAG: NAD(P)/FAD-dependent oxidoreductase [Gammaproteobacteria bacterium]|nr:NAD(P)/FAD-dependent oxidoreductase [Gammaproteobacteria bacterium]MDH3748959.1 NAD(P)/FAD-dependent oxidoreductase [Gammaproteobacteria bacterium]MDH3804604.1 NAD(P)/FAD-dependent oxidoreductase [Gammaproteobacteria bacterium]